MLAPSPARSPASACLVVSINRSVTPDIADTTITTGRLRFFSADRRAATRMRSALPTLVPPNFITRRSFNETPFRSRFRLLPVQVSRHHPLQTRNSRKKRWTALFQFLFLLPAFCNDLNGVAKPSQQALCNHPRLFARRQ